jgi:hypothetical protein
MPAFHLPVEVLAVIIRYIDDRPTLASLMSVSRATYDLAARPLYTDIVVTHRTRLGYRIGLLPTGLAPGEELLAGYPNAESDARKRALLALTETIVVALSRPVVSPRPPDVSLGAHNPRVCAGAAPPRTRGAAAV